MVPLKSSPAGQQPPPPQQQQQQPSSSPAAAAQKVDQPKEAKASPRTRRAAADPAAYDSTYKKDYGRPETESKPSEEDATAKASAVPALKIPQQQQPEGKKRSSMPASARSSVRNDSAALSSRQPAQVSENKPVKKAAAQARPRPRPKANYETEYSKNYRAYSNVPTPAATPRRVPACVHHVDPNFYTTTMQTAYAAPPSPAPVRRAYTRPTVTVRHMDPSMYVSANTAAYS